MRKIIKIIGIQAFVKSTKGEPDKKYFRTYALLDDGSEVYGYGDDFKVGDLVESFWHEEWNAHKMRKPS